jgi:Fe-S-cluster-containing hydrogenase component 2
MKNSINDIPDIDFNKCTGCGLCLSGCPGLAIFMIDMTYEENRALVSLPYEFLPLPEKGEVVSIIDRGGNILGEGEIIRIRNSKSQDRTPVITIAVEKTLAMKVRHFRRIGNENE